MRTDSQAFIPPTLLYKASKINEGHTLYLPDNWIIHATESGYMDRDVFFKVGSIFSMVMIYIGVWTPLIIQQRNTLILFSLKS